MMAEIQMCYTKTISQIIIIIIVHISYYYYFQSVQSPSQPQRAVHVIWDFLHLHRPQQPCKHPQRIISWHACDASGNLVQNGCHLVTETFFQPQFSGLGSWGQQSGPRSSTWEQNMFSTIIDLCDVTCSIIDKHHKPIGLTWFSH